MKRLTMMVAFFLALSIPLVAQDSKGQTEFKKSSKLSLEVTGISLTEDGPIKADKTVSAGEKIYIHFSVKGLVPKDNKVSVQTDLAIPELGIDVKNIIDDTYDFEKTILLNLHGPIPSDAAGGPAKAKIVVRDVNAKTYAETSCGFTVVPGKKPDQFTKSDKIKISLYSISAEERGAMKADKTFKAGDTVYINLTITGLAADNNKKAVVQADLNIPELAIDDKNILDASTEHQDSLPLFFKVTIETVYKNTPCNVNVIVRDIVAGTFVEYKTVFKVKK
jgi:hypothetical protein